MVGSKVRRRLFHSHSSPLTAPELSSQHYQAAGEWLILVFIPMAWSFICPTEIRAFSKRHQEFQACDCSVVFLSTDSEYALRAWAAHPEADGGLQHVQLPLASDRNLQISRAFGVLLPAAGVAQRALFFIDAAGIVRHAAVNDANGKALPLADRDLATADAALGRIASDVGAMDAPRPLDSPMASPSLYALMQNEEDPMDGRGRAVWNAGG